MAIDWWRVSDGALKRVSTDSKALSQRRPPKKQKQAAATNSRATAEPCTPHKLSRCSAARQLTLSVKVKVCVMVPLVAVTVMTWFATTGVPGLVGPVLPPPPPPPHAAIPIRQREHQHGARRDSSGAGALELPKPVRAAHRSRMRIAPAVVRHPPKSMWRLTGRASWERL